MDLYAKYAAVAMRTWVVSYVVVGSETAVASERTGVARVGRTLTIPAKTGDALYEAYRGKYTPTVQSTELEITAGGANAYAFEYVANCADLTVRKSVVGFVFPGQAFVFTVRSVDDPNFSLQVCVFGDSAVTVRDVPVGTYVVTEDSSWSWRYTPAASEQVVKVAAGAAGAAAGNEVTFTNTLSTAKWLTSTSSVRNVAAS